MPSENEARLERENSELRDKILELELQLRKFQSGPKHIAIEPKGDDPSKHEFGETAKQPPVKAGSKVQVGPLDINAIERELNITLSQEHKKFTTDGPQGCAMFCLIHDLSNQPSRETTISAAMQERGWNYSHQMLAPQLAHLVKSGDLIREGMTNAITFRVPGKLILSIDGKKIQ